MRKVYHRQLWSYLYIFAHEYIFVLLGQYVDPIKT